MKHQVKTMVDEVVKNRNALKQIKLLQLQIE
jgi:hypothetical protein